MISLKEGTELSAQHQMLLLGNYTFRSGSSLIIPGEREPVLLNSSLGSIPAIRTIHGFIVPEP